MTKTTLPDREQIRGEQFSARMLDILNGSMLCLMIGIGHKTGLFEVMAGLPPATSEQIATAAGLHERYVREWLAAMVTGQVIDYEPKSRTYHLPVEQAAVLTQAAGSDNMARLALVIPHLASVQPEVADSFRDGGGVPYTKYADFMNLWSEINAERYDATFRCAILPLIPDVIDSVRRGACVLDLGCGDGHLLRLMAKEFPASRFVGYDLLTDSIESARAQAREAGLSNLRFETLDVTEHDEPEQYTLIMAFDAIHDMARPYQVLRAIHKILKPDGTFLMVDLAASSDVHDNLDHPMGPWLYTTSCMHCMTVSLAQDGAGLGAMWGEQKALQMLAETGFIDVQVFRAEGDPFNNYYVARKAYGPNSV